MKRTGLTIAVLVVGLGVGFLLSRPGEIKHLSPSGHGSSQASGPGAGLVVSEGGARHRVDSEVTGPTREFGSPLLSCFATEDSYDDVEQCLRAAFEKNEITGEWIAGVICGGGLSQEQLQVLLLVFMQECDPMYIIDELNGAYSSCPHFTLDDAILAAVLRLKAIAPDIYAAIWAQLTPESFVREDGGLVAIRLAAGIAKEEDDGFLEAAIDACARGEFGGTPDQIDYAILAGWGLKESPVDRVAYYDGVFAGGMPPGMEKTSVGTSLAAILFSSGLDGGVTCDGRVSRARALFDDPRFGLAAALQVAREMPPSAPPCDIDEQQWKDLVAQALELTHAAGLDW